MLTTFSLWFLGYQAWMLSQVSVCTAGRGSNARQPGMTGRVSMPSTTSSGPSSTPGTGHAQTGGQTGLGGQTGSGGQT